MHFLVDTNLPPSLAVALVALGHEATHTKDHGLEQATDRLIWKHAMDENACIVTKDEDFVLLKAGWPLARSAAWAAIL